jgi:hypothetical protein
MNFKTRKLCQKYSHTERHVEQSALVLRIMEVSDSNLGYAEVSLIFLSLLRQLLGYSLKEVITASFHILSNSTFNYLTTRYYIT